MYNVHVAAGLAENYLSECQNKTIYTLASVIIPDCNVTFNAVRTNYYAGSQHNLCYLLSPLARFN